MNLAEFYFGLLIEAVGKDELCKPVGATKIFAQALR